MRVATALLYIRSTFTCSSPDNGIRGNMLVRPETQPVQPNFEIQVQYHQRHRILHNAH